MKKLLLNKIIEKLAVDSENNIITFPKREWNNIKLRLKLGKICYTIRVSNEYGKFKVGDILKTEWGSKIKILSIKKISGGIKALLNQYKFFNELTKEMIQELSIYDKMDIISFRGVSH